MSKQTEALKLALEALEQLQGGCTDHNDGTVEAITVWCPEVITVIREALAEQPAQQEPVGRLESDPYEGHVFVPRIDGDWSMLGKDLYTAPPAQRTWVGLTDEEIEKLTVELREIPVTLAFAIEAKLKEKNT